MRKPGTLYAREDVQRLLADLALTPQQFAGRYSVGVRTVYDWLDGGVPASANTTSKNALQRAINDRNTANAPVVRVDHQASELREDIMAALRKLDVVALMEIKQLAERKAAAAYARQYPDVAAEALSEQVGEDGVRPEFRAAMERLKEGLASLRAGEAQRSAEPASGRPPAA